MKHILLKKFSLVYIYKRNLDPKTKVVCIFKILTSKFYKKGF